MDPVDPLDPADLPDQSSHSQPVCLPAPSSDPYKSVATTPQHTFLRNNTIIAPTRFVQIHKYCYALYSTLHKVPLAVHQFLDRAMVQGNASREGKDFKAYQTNCQGDEKFYVDYSIYEQTKAYKSMSYDRGHMAPASNYLGNQEYLDATYTYANCIPQDSYFNRGSWKNLESFARNLLRNNLCDTVEVISGPVFHAGTPHMLHPNLYDSSQIVMLEDGLVVPPRCYKIIKANVRDQAYVSAFVMRNEKFIDNEYQLRSFQVTVEKLELMTGLRFELKDYRNLAELDPTTMNKTMGDLHLEFYTKLFKNAKSLADMNAAKIQGHSYKVKVDINCLPLQTKVACAQRSLLSIINEQGWTVTRVRHRRKINTLLSLHKDATDLEALTPQLEAKIIQHIRKNIEPAKQENQTSYHNYIANKLYKNNYGYVYPCQEELRTVFVNLKPSTSEGSAPLGSTPEGKGKMSHNATPKKAEGAEEKVEEQGPAWSGEKQMVESLVEEIVGKIEDLTINDKQKESEGQSKHE